MRTFLGSMEKDLWKCVDKSTNVDPNELIYLGATTRSTYEQRDASVSNL